MRSESGTHQQSAVYLHLVDLHGEHTRAKSPGDVSSLSVPATAAREERKWPARDVWPPRTVRRAPVASATALASARASLTSSLLLTSHSHSRLLIRSPRLQPDCPTRKLLIPLGKTTCQGNEFLLPFHLFF